MLRVQVDLDPLSLLPKDIQLLNAFLLKAACSTRPAALSAHKSCGWQIKKAVKLMKQAKRPIIYGGGGLINSGPETSEKLKSL